MDIPSQVQDIHIEIAAVVVTHNRQDMLARCLNALKKQTRLPGFVIVVDNASTDGTAELLLEQSVIWSGRLITVHLPTNSGGAGGFEVGMVAALASDCEWVWVMDDDADPAVDALQYLMVHLDGKNQVLGCLAGNDGLERRELCWPPFLKNGKLVLFAHDLPGPKVEVEGLPFLGFLIHRSMIEQVGPPDGSLFLSLDDIEYCERLKQAGARFFLVRDSFISHPLPERRIVHFAGLTFVLVRQAPWKNYYNARNRLIVAHRYYGLKLWTATLPSVLLRMLFAVLTGPSPWGQILAYSRAILDGFLGRVGPKIIRQ